MDCPSTSFCRPHYGGRCTLGVETTQPQAVRWDNRSKRVSDNFLTQANLYTNDDAILCRIFPTSLKGATLTWYGGLPPRSINSFDTLVKRFSAQYATIPQKVDGQIWAHDRPNPKSQSGWKFLALRLNKFVNSLCKKLPGSMDKLRERAKGYIQMEVMSKFQNEVRQVGQKCDKHKAHTKPNSHT
ncbi:hypothetical protein JHK85_025418 [Glycine max]|nr:hypothetical protein JHK85_025418 [Glycine max]